MTSRDSSNGSDMVDSVGKGTKTGQLAEMASMKSTRFVTNSSSGEGQNIILIGDDISSKGNNKQGDPSKFININSLPQEIRDQLNVFDLDGDGIIDSSEMLNAASAQESMKWQNSLLRKGMMFVGALAVALVGVVSGMTYFIVQSSKETVVEGRALYNKHQEPVGVNVNTIAVPLGSITFMPREFPSMITEISFRDENGNDYYRTKESIDIAREKSIVLKTTSGDVISWDVDVDGGADIHISLADGSSWSSSALCNECSMTSVVADEAVVDAVGAFFETIGLQQEEGRQLVTRYGGRVLGSYLQGYGNRGYGHRGYFEGFRGFGNPSCI